MNPYTATRPADRLRADLTAARLRIAQLEKELAEARAENLRLKAGLGRRNVSPYWAI